MTAQAPVLHHVPSSPLAGLAVCCRLAVRLERLPILLWGAAILGAVLSSVSAIASLYPDAASRAQLASTILANPAFLALNGPLAATSIGGVAAWRIGVYGGLAVGYLSASTVIRRTRTEEETGRAELLASGVLGRFTLLAAALVMAWTTAAGIGLLCALGCVAQGQPVGGAVALGAALTGPGLVFAGLAGVTAQVFESSRAALSAAGLALGVAYAVRAVADTQPSVRWLSYVSPLGWSQRLAPYGATQWWVLALFAGSSAVLTAVAIRLQRGRDNGLGLFRARPGPAENPRLHSGIGLAARQHRSFLSGWIAGLVVIGALTGALAATSGSLLTDNAKVEQIVEQISGAGRPADELFAVMAALAGLLVAAYAVAAALRIRGEESRGRAELALSTGLSRIRFMADHLLFAVGGAAALLVVAGLASGLVYGLQIGNLGRGLGTGLAAMAVQLPAALVVAGLTAALIGWLPRQANSAWALLAGFFLLGQLGSTLGLPQAVMDLSPFAHVPPLPTGTFAVTPLAVLTVLAAATTAVGFIGFQRRDLG